MNAIIENILIICGYDNQDQKNIEISLEAIANRVIKIYKFPMDEGKVKINLLDLIAISAIPHQFSLIFKILIDNSIKYNKSEIPKMTISSNIQNNYHFFLLQRLCDRYSK